MRVYDYFLLLKPKVLLAMVALYIASYLSSLGASGGDLFDATGFMVGFAAVLAAVGGANALNCYLERDIDAVMVRTKRRPLPRGSVSPRAALGFSLLLITSASAISFLLGFLPLLLFIVGIGFYIVVYTVLLKRRTSLNVFATAPSVASPAWFGWVMGGSPINFQALVLGMIIAVWGMFHLWSLAYVFNTDYSRGRIPMLPVVVSTRKAEQIIFASLVVLASYSYLLSLWSKTIAYVAAISLINLPLIITGLKFLLTPSRRTSWWLFKLSAPYIIIILFSFSLDHYLFS